MGFLFGFKFFGKRGELFDKNGFLIVMNIFADKVFAFTIEKAKGLQLKSYVEESIEENVYGGLDFDRIKLNCAKAKDALFKKGFKSSNVIFAFSPEFACTKLFRKGFARRDSEQKISKKEIDDMVVLVKQELVKQKERMFFDNIERILIDGYVIADPVGMRGKELEISIVGASYNNDLNKQFEDLSRFLNLNLKDIFSIDREFIRDIAEKKEIKDAVFINIFENHTSIFLLRSSRIAALDRVNIGYGVLDLKISEAFGVGREEAKNLRRLFASGSMDVSVIDRIRSLAVSAAEELLYKTKLSLGLIDKESLLPSDVFVSFFGNAFLQAEQVFLKGNNWFSDLPIDQNANVYFLSPRDIQENIIPELSDRQYSFIYVIMNKINSLNKNT